MYLENVSYFFKVFVSERIILDRQNVGRLDVSEMVRFVSVELNQLSGVAAILRFPIADVSEAEDSSSDED